MVQSTVDPMSEVPEEAAEGPVKGVYDDIKSTLRVPLVNLVFRVLATHPEYLRIAWRQLKPNAGTVFFERRADAIRAEAVLGAASVLNVPAAPEAARDTLSVFHYANPKILLAVAALRAATNGQYPKLEELPPEEKRALRPGVPDTAPAVHLPTEDSATEPVADIFAGMRAASGLPFVNSDYRALSAWPEYLEGAWTAIQPVIASPDYRQLERRLRRMAEETILVLPFRVEINPHIMRLCGLSEGDIDEVRITLERFYRLLPGLIINIAALTSAAIGQENAERSPYPAETV